MSATSLRTISRRTTLLVPFFAPTMLRARENPFGVLERRHGGRLGVGILNTHTGTRLYYRAQERFALCSTYKLLAVSLVLNRVDGKQEYLDRRILFSRDRLTPHSPVTEKYVNNGLTLAEICEAALTVSDNTAANLILESFGGPPAITAYARSLGDTFTRLDRTEPDLNEAAPGDLRDTTTPRAMLQDLETIVMGDALSEASRRQLITWLVANKTGDRRLRAGLPEGWRAGDKTGSGSNGVSNDVAVAWPPERRPLIITTYFTESKASDEQRDLVLAEVGRVAASV